MKNLIVTLLMMSGVPSIAETVSKNSGGTPLVMAIQGVNFGANHPGSTINELKRSCDGEVKQIQCRRIEGLNYNDEFCFGICYIE